MRLVEIEWTGTPNYRKGRQGRKPVAIVDHITAGYMPGCLSWMQNPAAQSSAHYLVTKDGRILQLVKDEDTAWHAGAVNKPTWPLYDGSNPNRYTIGIEHEGQPNEPLTEAQYEATLLLHEHLTLKHGIPIDKNHIIGHYRIDSVNRPNCPGPAFPWGRLFNDLGRGGRMSMEVPKWKKDALRWAEQTGIVQEGTHQAGATVDIGTLCAILKNYTEQLDVKIRCKN